MLKVNSDSLYEAAMQYEMLSFKLRKIAATLESASAALMRSSDTFNYEGVLIRKKSTEVTEKAETFHRMSKALETLAEQYSKCERDNSAKAFSPARPVGLWHFIGRPKPAYVPAPAPGSPLITPKQFSATYDTLIDPLISRL